MIAALLALLTVASPIVGTLPNETRCAPYAYALAVTHDYWSASRPCLGEEDSPMVGLLLTGAS